MIPWEKLLGCPSEVLENDAGFGWQVDGLGTKYLLIAHVDDQLVVKLFGTACESRSELVERLNMLLNMDQKCLLLGVETKEICSTFFRLDPRKAISRLA